MISLPSEQSYTIMPFEYYEEDLEGEESIASIVLLCFEVAVTVWIHYIALKMVYPTFTGSN